MMLDLQILDGLELSKNILAIDNLRFVDSILSVIAYIGLIMYVFSVPTLNRVFWVLFGVLYLVWDLMFNIVLKPISLGIEFDMYSLIFPILFIPWYFSFFHYAKTCINSGDTF